MNKITFEIDDEGAVAIMRAGKRIGQIFSPSGTGRDVENAIQVCGFSDAFDYWGCGPFKGFKDIQLLFDDHKMGGEFAHALDGCARCYRRPCCCETKKGVPFVVKRLKEVMLERI